MGTYMWRLRAGEKLGSRNGGPESRSGLAGDVDDEEFSRRKRKTESLTKLNFSRNLALDAVKGAEAKE